MPSHRDALMQSQDGCMHSAGGCRWPLCVASTGVPMAPRPPWRWVPWLQPSSLGQSIKEPPGSQVSRDFAHWVTSIKWNPCLIASKEAGTWSITLEHCRRKSVKITLPSPIWWSYKVDLLLPNTEPAFQFPLSLKDFLLKSGKVSELRWSHWGKFSPLVKYCLM